MNKKHEVQEQVFSMMTEYQQYWRTENNNLSRVKSQRICKS